MTDICDVRYLEQTNMLNADMIKRILFLVNDEILQSLRCMRYYMGLEFYY